jgi:hypothetical protein
VWYVTGGSHHSVAIEMKDHDLVDNITRLGLTVDQLLPLHGRIVPLADLHRAVGRAN